MSIVRYCESHLLIAWLTEPLLDVAESRPIPCATTLRARANSFDSHHEDGIFFAFTAVRPLITHVFFIFAHRRFERRRVELLLVNPFCCSVLDSTKRRT